MSSRSLNRNERRTYVHDRDAGSVKFVHNVLGGDTNGTDEELGLLLDYDINEGMKLALCVVVLNSIRDMRMGVSYGKR